MALEDGSAIAELARVVKPSEVLEALMNDGTFDGLRGKVTAHLKNNEELKQYTQTLVETSQTLNSPGAESRTRRELFDALRRELEGPVLDKCSKAAWELILSKEGLGKEVSDAVDATYGKLSSSQAEVQAADVRTPSEEGQAFEKRTPSQERNDESARANGYYSHADGREGRDYRAGSRESERSRDRDYYERPKNRDRDLYERRDAAREYGGSSGGRDREYSEGGRHFERGRDYSERSRGSGDGSSRDRDYQRP